MAKKKKRLVKLKCKNCGNINYFTFKSQKLIAKGEKLNLKKFCKKCRKHTEHQEVKR